MHRKPKTERERRVVVTGIGLISPVGLSTEETWAALLRGESGVKPITLFDCADHATKIAGEVVGFRAEMFIDRKDIKKMGRFIGAFTGALKDRAGLLRTADGGVLFLDEIGELGLDEQAMLLRALEEKTFLPLGSDREVKSDFQLIAGTNRDLPATVRQGRFREDLLSRINMWTFTLPGLRLRPEDIEPNLQFEIDQFGERTGRRIAFSKEARQKFLAMALSAEAKW